MQIQQSTTQAGPSRTRKEQQEKIHLITYLPFSQSRYAVQNGLKVMHEGGPLYRNLLKCVQIDVRILAEHVLIKLTCTCTAKGPSTNDVHTERGGDLAQKCMTEVVSCVSMSGRRGSNNRRRPLWMVPMGMKENIGKWQLPRCDGLCSCCYRKSPIHAGKSSCQGQQHGVQT